MLILEENFRQHLEAFASELFVYIFIYIYYPKWLTNEDNWSNQNQQKSNNMLWQVSGRQTQYT